MSSQKNDIVASRHGDVQHVKEASLIGIPREIRLRIYSLIFVGGEPIDTILVKANAKEIMGTAHLALSGKPVRVAFSTRTEVTAKLEKWDERCLFLVCRVVFVEATAIYYNQSLFDFHSARQCLDWLERLTPRTRSLVRHIAVPTDIRPHPDDMLLMKTLPKLTPDLRTLRISCPSQMYLYWYHSICAGKWFGYWDKWIARWGEAVDRLDCEYRIISAATATAADDNDKDPEAELYKARLDYIIPHIAKMPCLRAVYLSPELEAARDNEIAQVLAKLELMRDAREMSTVGPAKD